MEERELRSPEVREEESTEIRERAEIIDRKLHGLINSLRSR
jgi:hypothetical protein